MSSPDFESDHKGRSRYLREMTLDQLRSDADGSPSRNKGTRDAIPATLVQYWHDPTEVPLDVQECMDTWSVLPANGIVRRVFDDRSARAYISHRLSRLEVAAFDRCRHPAMRSDYFRMCFIYAEGGLYVDADDALQGDGWPALFVGDKLKLHPLGYDIASRQMLTDEELMNPELPEEGRVFYVNNNPLVAPPKHRVIRAALERATRILAAESKPEIQSTTGPGNMTISLVEHAFDAATRGDKLDVELLLDWESIAETRWHLGYRNDQRNWRNMD